MTEQQIKEICKLIIENGSREITKEEKEILKKLVDEAHDVNELALVALSCLTTTMNR